LCSLVDRDSADETLVALLSAIPRRRVDLDLEVAHFRSNYATGKIIACAMWACDPRSLRTGEVIDRPTLAESLGEAQTPRPALTRIASHGVLDRDVRESAASWLLVPGLEAAPAEVIGILRTRPIDIDEAVWDLALSSHCVDDGVLVYLSTGDIGAFVRSRQVVLQDRVDRFLLQRWEWGFEDTPPIDSLVMDDLESDVDDQ
jgi:hypothetical protein